MCSGHGRPPTKIEGGGFSPVARTKAEPPPEFHLILQIQRLPEREKPVSLQAFEFEEEALPAGPSPAKTNGKANGAPTTPTQTPQQPASPKTKFASVSADTARKAKKGGVSKSRTGKTRQATVEFSKPPKHLYVKAHPSAAYRQYGVPVFIDKDRDTTHYVPVELYEGDTLPERFKRACTITNIFTAALADGTFILWTVNQSATKWYKAAMRAVEAASREFVLVEAMKARSTYMIEPSDGTIPEPKWDVLPPFEGLLEGAFDSTIIGANDEVVSRYMSGGHWEESDAEGGN